MIDEGKKLLLGYNDIDILSNREFSIVQKYTFGAFYLHFLAETKKKFIEELGSIYNPDMFCNGIPELILSRLHAVCVRALIVEMSMYKAAGRLKGNNSGEEYDELEQAHNTTYGEFKTVRDDLHRLWKVKSCVDTATRFNERAEEQKLQNRPQTRHKKEELSR